MSKSFAQLFAPKLVRDVALRVAHRCDELAQHSDDSACISRTFCTPAMKSAHEQLSQWFRQAGLKVRTDAAANLIGHRGRRKKDDGNSVFLIGSHLDTVINAGKFDGALGVLLGLGVAEVLEESKIQLPYDLDIVGFSEEEGVRFGFPFIGSRAIAGTFSLADLDRRDRYDVSLREALQQFGCNPDEIPAASYRDRNVIGFMEAHLEQAVVLQEANCPVGVVSAIAGQTRARIVFEGKSGHAGTVPHDRRQDALAAAASLILKIEQLGQETGGLFATVGRVISWPGLSNVIAGRTELLLDLRHESDAIRKKAFKTVELMIMETARFRNVVGVMTQAEHSLAVPMDEKLSRQLQHAASQQGLNVGRLVSGAGHDAMVMAQMAPCCMLFVRCRDGISHHPDEYVSPEDIAVALQVMVSALPGLSNDALQPVAESRP